MSDQFPFTVPETGAYEVAVDVHTGKTVSIKRAPHLDPPNRWAAFTDDELNRIGRGLLSLEFHALHTSQPARLEPQQLRDEISREIERRRA